MQIRPQYSPINTRPGVHQFLPAALSAQATDGKSKLSTNGLISHSESGFEIKHCIRDIFNIWQMTLGMPDSIFYGMYCCNYDMKVAISS